MNKARAKKIAGKTADATAGVLGGVLRLSLRIIMTAVLVFITTGLLFACIFAYYIKSIPQEQLDVVLESFDVALSSTIWYTDDEGENHELTTLTSLVKREWVDYENIPEDMEHALVAIEDRRFYEHKGVDWYRTTGAFANMFLTMRNDFGGSTITQQLIKNATTNDDATVKRKLLEIFQALELEKNYTKEEIVEWYLNYVYFGQGCYGVYTAAQTYFGKDVWDLSLAECASIVGITNNPSKYDPFGANMITDKDLGLTMSNREWNKYRQETILYEMYDQGYISYEEYKKAVAEELNFVRAENEAYTMEIYSYYEEVVINDVIQDLMEQRNISEQMASDLVHYGGYQIYCCIDPEIQAVVDSVYENVENLPQSYRGSSQQFQSAIVIMDPYTGEIKALSGGVGEKAINYGTNRVKSLRPAGSSTKPLSIYGPALEYGLITQNTLVNDSPDIKLAGHSTWYPKNSPNRYDGIITIREALRDSKNTVAAQILDKLSPAESYDYMVNKLGFTTLAESDCDYAPLAMGQYTYGVTVREMAQAYCTFPNSGIFTQSRTYTKVLDSNGNVVLDNQPQTHQAFSANTAANICNMLENAVSTGTGTGAYFYGQAVAGKTGTTSANCDRYFCGFTPYYVAAVWTGYDTPEPMYFYGNPACSIFKTIMSQIHEGLEYKSFPWPSIGQPTTIFGDLAEEKEKQDNPEPETSPEPSEDPAPSESPTVTDDPQVTDTPTESDTPATDSPTPEPPPSTEPPIADEPVQA